jgi:hypothetical protein
MFSRKNEPVRVICHDPSRASWWTFGFHPDSGKVGRIRWFNSDQEEGAWGRVFMTRD